jgi:AAA15 family ATPase/GTPase
MMAEDFFSDEGSAQFFQLIEMLHRTGLINLGMIPVEEGKVMWNFSEAKAAIDILQMLQEKTKGNLIDNENKLLNGIVAQLQLEFVRAPQRKKQMDKDAVNVKEVKQAFSNPRDGPVETVSDDANEEE